MASAYPHRPLVDHTPRKQTDISVNSDDQTQILQSIASETAQAILRTLSDNPATASDIADAVDTSLQNTQYHLERLSEADIVTPVGTWYSARGRQMTVYALTAEELHIQL